MKFPFALLYSLLTFSLFCQTKLDTLLHKLKTARHDTAVFNAYMDLGNYFQNSNPDTAIYFHTQAEKVAEKIPSAEGELRKSASVRAKGWDHYILSDYTQALTLYETALKIAEKYLGEKDKIVMMKAKKLWAADVGNIGVIYRDQGNYAKALEYYFKALQINEEIGDKKGQAVSLGNIGSTYLKLKQFSKAEEYLKQSEQLNRELGTIYHLKSACASLSELYEQTDKYKDALYYYKEYAKANDSLNSEQNRKALQTMELKYQYEKEQAIKEAEHQKQLEIQRKEKERQKVISYAVGGGLVLVLIFSILIFNRLQITRKQKQIIEEQKQEVEAQKKLVEEKNKEITDSIVYAKRIQDAILPSESKWQELLPDSFVFYLPKDIVAGDFYWLEETEDYIFVAAADCTGHGVPGAMVSVVCSNALTKSVLEEKIFETDKILNRTKEIVTEKLSASEKHIQDGMDVALVRISKKNRRQVQFSGANRPMLIIGQGGMQEISGDKQPVGLYESGESFTAKELELKEGEEIFLFTDGIADQFGGDKGKKMGSKRFKEFLREVAGLSIAEQKERLKAYYFEWKQKEDQTDDVTVMGIKG